MAKLTGEAMPVAPRRYLHPQNSSHALPTLGDLRERVKLKRSHTVTGVGGSRVVSPVQADVPAPTSPVPPAATEGGERTAARVNLMRKLSSRKLETPAAKDSLEARDREREQSRLDVVGRRGQARPRSGSIGDWRPAPEDWSRHLEHLPSPSAPPTALSFAPATSQPSSDLRSDTPFSIRSSGAWTEERDRQSVLARQAGETAWEFDGASQPRTSDDGDDQSEVIVEVVREPVPVDDDYGLTPRVGGGSALWDADQTPQMRIARHDSSGFGFPHRERRRSSSVSSPSPPASPAADGLGVDFGVPPSPRHLRRGSIPSYLLPFPPGSSFSSHSEYRRPGGPASFGIAAVEETDSLANKVERKRAQGLARSKEGAFPPPEEGYQFPSPTLGSPRMSEDTERPKSPHNKAPPPTIFIPSYMPLSFSEALGGTTNLQPVEPLSPTTSLPPPPLVEPPPVPSSSTATATTLERSTSTSSKQSKKKWFGAGLFGSNGATAAAATAAAVAPESPASQSSEMTREGSARSHRSTIMARSASGDSNSAPNSNYASSTEMLPVLSSSSTESLLDPTPRGMRERLPASEQPASKILARLDSILGTSELDSSAPSVLDNPPRKLLLHTPVLQIVNAHTVKDRHLFLFSDLLLIAKPLLDDHPLTGVPLPSTLESAFVVKSIVELRDLKLMAIDDPSEDQRPKTRHKDMLTFIDRFANDPTRAIAHLVQNGAIANDAPTVANLLFRNPDLNRNQVGTFLAATKNRHILKAYVDKFRLGGVRIDDALRVFLMTMRLPHDLAAAEHVLGVVALAWAETNGSSGFDPSLTTSLVLAIMRLSDALHAGGTAPGGAGLFSGPNRHMSVDDFVASFREHDPRLLVPEQLLSQVYTAVRRERIEQASDNSMFSMTPDIEATVAPARIPGRLTYRVASESITITIPEPDPDFRIKLHGNDLKFDPPHLSFAKSATQTFRVTGTALGLRAMVLIKLGANAPRYQGLPLSKVFSVERAFMLHTFQISFVNHLDVKRKVRPPRAFPPFRTLTKSQLPMQQYMLSTLDASVRATWLQAIRERTDACLAAPLPPTRALQAGSAVAVQVLREALIAPESTLPNAAGSSSTTASPRPTTATRFASSVPATPRIGRLGTPTRPGAPAHARSNSFSRTYAAGVGKVEADLVAERDRRAQNSSAAAQTRRGSRDDAEKSPFVKSGKAIQLVTEQNSLLPLVLSFLSAGAAVSTFLLCLLSRERFG
ncbi:hypothetical protein RQP46_003748 [Phenoliferia psychrophenolica]